jgi:hypothetical protein
LCGEILAAYIRYDYENSPPVEKLDDDTDNILFESVEIWLAAAAGSG